MILKSATSPSQIQVIFEPQDFPKAELLPFQQRLTLPATYNGTSDDPYLIDAFRATIASGKNIVINQSELIAQVAYPGLEVLAIADARYGLTNKNRVEELESGSYRALYESPNLNLTGQQITDYLATIAWVNSSQTVRLAVFSNRPDWQEPINEQGITADKIWSRIALPGNRSYRHEASLLATRKKPLPTVEKLVLVTHLLNTYQGFFYEKAYSSQNNDFFSLLAKPLPLLLRMAEILNNRERDINRQDFRKAFTKLTKGMSFVETLNLLETLPREWARELT